MGNINWWLVRWKIARSTSYRTNWRKSQEAADKDAKRAEAKGHEVVDFKPVSGNGKRK